MTEEMKLAKKKVVILAASLGCFAAASCTLPSLAVQHGFRAVWVVLPLVAIETVAMTYVLIALFALRRLR